MDQKQVSSTKLLEQRLKSKGRFGMSGKISNRSLSAISSEQSDDTVDSDK